MKSTFNPWPYGVIAFFIILACSLAAVVVIAETHRDTLVSANYYEQELQYQDHIDSAMRGQKSGASIRLDAAAGKIMVAVPAGQVAQKFSGAVEFYRPSAPELDRTLPLVPAADGSQPMDVSQLATGLWEVHMKWTAGGQNYFLEQKVTL